MTKAQQDGGASGDGGLAPLVVVVNNEAAILKLARQYLEDAGLRVAPFASAATALEAPELLEAALVITDQHNRPLSGLGLWEHMRKRGIMTPMAFLSAWADDMEKMFEGAADQPVAYFQLPVSFKVMAREVSALVRRHSDRVP